MGGHAFYVWSAYAAALLVLLGFPLALAAAYKKTRANLLWQAQIFLRQREQLQQAQQQEVDSDPEAPRAGPDNDPIV